MAAAPASPVPTISPAEMQILISRSGLVLNPGQMADLVLAWRQVAGLIAMIPQGRGLADDMALTFRPPPPVAAPREASVAAPVPPRAAAAAKPARPQAKPAPKPAAKSSGRAAGSAAKASRKSGGPGTNAKAAASPSRRSAASATAKPPRRAAKAPAAKSARKAAKPAARATTKASARPRAPRGR